MRPYKFLLIPITLILTSCDQNARNFAKQAKAMLDEYAVRIDMQIQTESSYYQRDAVLEVKHHHENLLNAGKADRGERFAELAVTLQEGGKSPSRIRTYLGAYAQSEFKNRQDAYYQEADATRQYLRQLQALQADKDRVDALGKLLDSLSVKPGLAAEVNAIKQSVAETKADFDQLICGQIAGKLKTAAGADKDSLTKLQTDRKCPSTTGVN